MGNRKTEAIWHWASAVLLCASCHAVADTWPTYQHDAAHTGRSAARFNPADLQFAWKAPNGFSIPLPVGNSVYSLQWGTTQRLASFALSDGSINWEHNITPPCLGAPTYAEGLLVYTAGTQLYVRDAATGALKYSVPSVNSTASMVTVHRNPSTDKLVAYVTSNLRLQAVELGEDSGTVLWSGMGTFGSGSIPTVAGHSIIVASPFHYYAFHMNTGQRHIIESSSSTGGGGSTVTYDDSNGHIYISEKRSPGSGLTAYAYAGNNAIVQIWNKSVSTPGIDTRNDVAIDRDGFVYSCDETRLVKLDPSTGNELDFVIGNFANGMTPMISDGYIWTFGDEYTAVYDTGDLELVRSFSGARGDLNSNFKSPGALSNRHFLLDYGRPSDREGFDVYVVPEPTTLMLFLLGGGCAFRRKKRPCFSRTCALPT